MQGDGKCYEDKLHRDMGKVGAGVKLLFYMG